ncbi:hypothetical protein IBTHAUMO2_990010 [Nitrosopumilaceae archaeon]|nr:hypothetical protein [Nitrosopumilus sp.]CAI9832778.1 hypothetical protein IBTHAUMO2_990010 [Nitrosopumilaceae archaeon]MDA7944400.1 hypothetical protein [Nitrosopumilus sp.]MDA7954152.1 hypothetical protein [Nitrosopumilus sp.]MDA7973080.1 hypothetical protein [Nitrosopumilus sp.]
MALQLETDEARRGMYMLLRSTEFNPNTERIMRAERIHEALFVFRSIRRLPPGDFEIKRDGCYSPSLALALEEAVESGEVIHGTEGGLDTYLLTERGITAAHDAWDAADIYERADASDAKYTVSGITDRELVSFLYAEFPETWTDPAMKARAKEWGFQAACSMHDRGKVSITTGSWMAGMDYEGFMKAFMAAGYVMCKRSAEEMQKNVDGVIELGNANWRRHPGEADRVAGGVPAAPSPQTC